MLLVLRSPRLSWTWKSGYKCLLRGEGLDSSSVLNLGCSTISNSQSNKQKRQKGNKLNLNRNKLLNEFTSPVSLKPLVPPLFSLNYYLFLNFTSCTFLLNSWYLSYFKVLAHPTIWLLHFLNSNSWVPLLLHKTHSKWYIRSNGKHMVSIPVRLSAAQQSFLHPWLLISLIDYIKPFPPTSNSRIHSCLLSESSSNISEKSRE